MCQVSLLTWLQKWTYCLIRYLLGLIGTYWDLLSHQVLNLSKQLQDIKSQRPLHQPWTTAAKVEVGSASVTSAWAPLGTSSAQPGPSIASWQTPTLSRKGILAGHQHLHWSNIQQVPLIKEDRCRQCYLKIIFTLPRTDCSNSTGRVPVQFLFRAFFPTSIKSILS